jgi:hypothetical protein
VTHGGRVLYLCFLEQEASLLVSELKVKVKVDVFCIAETREKKGMHFSMIHGNLSSLNFVYNHNENPLGRMWFL